MEPRKHEAEFVKWCSDSGIEQLAKSDLLGGFIADSTEIRYEAYSAGAEKKEEENAKLREHISKLEFTQEELNTLLAKAREEGRILGLAQTCPACHSRGYEEGRKEALQEAMQIADNAETAGYVWVKLSEMLSAAPTPEPTCNPHPDAPHGFCRNASHNEGRYVCGCDGWKPEVKS